MPLLRLMLCVATLVLATSVQGAALDDPERLPGSAVAQGHDFAAWLILPTRRYDHFVHANEAEAGGMRVAFADGRTVSLVLPPTMVFEDSQIRLADLDGDGRDEIVVVLTSLVEGASLAVYEVSDDGIALRARTPFIGQPHRWLNPAAIADFDGDGRAEIALVMMPHLERRLEIWRLERDGLKRLSVLDDVSNHRLGTPQTALAIAFDANGDGIDELAIPNGAGDTLRLLRLVAGRLVELAQAPLNGTATGNLSVEAADQGPVVVVPLAAGGSRRVAFAAGPG